MSRPSAPFRPFAALSAAALAAAALMSATPAAAGGEPEPVSSVIAGGPFPVLVIRAGAATCASFTVDEQGSRSSSYTSEVTVDEVLAWPEDAGDAPAPGDGMLLGWTDFALSPLVETDGCTTLPYRLFPGTRTAVVLDADERGWAIQSAFYDDVSDREQGEGDLPPCGEEEAREVLGALGFVEEEPDPTAPDMDQKEPGCSAAGGASAGLLLPFAGLLGALGLRRRG